MSWDYRGVHAERCPCRAACDPVPVEPDVEVFEGREVGTSFAERVGHVVLYQRG